MFTSLSAALIVTRVLVRSTTCLSKWIRHFLEILLEELNFRNILAMLDLICVCYKKFASGFQDSRENVDDELLRSSSLSTRDKVAKVKLMIV